MSIRGALLLPLMLFDHTYMLADGVLKVSLRNLCAFLILSRSHVHSGNSNHWNPMLCERANKMQQPCTLPVS